ncbi:hypothetical protein HU200_055142 [Digitaria exilis]|uniref:Uncharacterized protein n=1 Tax=Digitaria exilis TaxID=1010633 RepID=A0A835AEE3_9POAL|nr:hypothetical protein HU200_055142 [Digitaria exilis]
MKKKNSSCGGCLGAPMRALSRACDSACDLYVRGMSRCARRVPSGASAAGVVGRGFAGASSLRSRVSSDDADDLVRAAVARNQRRVAAESERAARNKKKGGAGAKQRRVAAEPAETVGYYGDAGKKGGGAPTRKKGGPAAVMGTIAEDEPCEFGPDGACAVVPSSLMKPPRRAGFGAFRAGTGSDGVFARWRVHLRVRRVLY